MTWVLREATTQVVSIQDIMTLKRCSLTEALFWIQKHHPEWLHDTELLNDLMGMVKDAHDARLVHSSQLTRTHASTVSTRPKFIAAAWLLGASWGQLASLFGVRRETILRSADRLLPYDTRHDLRRATTMPYETLVDLRDAWAAMDTEKVSQLSVSGLMDALTSNG